MKAVADISTVPIGELYARAERWAVSNLQFIQEQGYALSDSGVGHMLAAVAEVALKEYGRLKEVARQEEVRRLHDQMNSEISFGEPELPG